MGLGPNDPLPRDPAQVAFVERAAADLFDAAQKYRRAEQLFRDQLISQQLDEASPRFKGARAAHHLAVQEVEQLEAQLQSSEAASELAEKKLADTAIRAPFPGSVKERRVSPGEYLKKNGILQVDYTNRLLGEGIPLREALLEANRVRRQPILMTTFSIVAGLIPVALGIGAGSEQRAAIAVTIIGGQTLCLLLTLLVVPAAYSYLAELEATTWPVTLGGTWGRLRAGFARRFGSF